MDHQTRIDEIHPSAYPSQCVLDAGGLSSSAMLRDQEILKDRLPIYFPRPRSIRLLCDGGWRRDFKEHKIQPVDQPRKAFRWPSAAGGEVFIEFIYVIQSVPWNG